MLLIKYSQKIPFLIFSSHRQSYFLKIEPTAVLKRYRLHFARMEGLRHESTNKSPFLSYFISLFVLFVCLSESKNPPHAHKL